MVVRMHCRRGGGIYHCVIPDGMNVIYYAYDFLRAISLVILNFASHQPQLHIMRLVATLSLVVVASLNLASFRFSYSKEQQ